MTDNTPLNADDELEKNILYIIEAHFKPSDNSLMPLNATKRVMQIILANRKKHELQARIDENRACQGIVGSVWSTSGMLNGMEKRTLEFRQELENLKKFWTDEWKKVVKL